MTADPDPTDAEIDEVLRDIQEAQESFKALVEASSLGTANAALLRSTVSDEDAAAILRRASESDVLSILMHMDEEK